MVKILITRKVNDERVSNIAALVNVSLNGTLTRASSIGFTELTLFCT